MRWLLPLIAIVVLVSAAPASAAAPVVWATVNVCDTSTAPDQIGIRGSMAGLSRRAVLAMRFRVQFQTPTGQWRQLRRGGLSDSKWQRVALAKGGVHDSGWTFKFAPPKTGGAHVLRGVVSFQWRRGPTVVRRARAVTTAGHPGTAGADPADFSAATCEIA